MQEKELGFHEEWVVSIPVRDPVLQGRAAYIKETLGQAEGVLNVSSSATLPGYPTPGTSVSPLPEMGGDEFKAFMFFIDEAYLPTMGIELLAGRNFRGPSDAQNAIIINEAMALALGYPSAEAALNKGVEIWGSDKEVVGIAKDFHFESVRTKIEPLILFPDYEGTQGLVLRLEGGQPARQLAALREQWEKLSQNQPFTYSFLDQKLALQYIKEQQLSQVMNAASALAILLACLGLLGLAAFAVERRTKEIGMRRILGASARQILTLFNREFLQLVALAILIAGPLSWWGMQHWLAGFAYAVEPGIGIFLASAAIALGIAFITVSGQALRSVWVNPVEALRNE